MIRDLTTKRAYATPAAASHVRNAEDGSGGVEVVINTADLDRHKTIIEPGGAVLDNYAANGIVLANHDLNQVLGTSEVRQEGDQLVARMKKWAADATAQTWKSRIESGIVKAASIGFRVLKYVEEKSKEFGTYYRITKWELVEWSWVSVPSNPNALARGIQPLTLGDPNRVRMPKGGIRLTDAQLDRLLTGRVHADLAPEGRSENDPEPEVQPGGREGIIEGAHAVFTAPRLRRLRGHRLAEPARLTRAQRQRLGLDVTDAVEPVSLPDRSKRYDMRPVNVRGDVPAV